jgi:dTDP-4-dehydrorhamnose 3,5-epimerase-like enzyme
MDPSLNSVKILDLPFDAANNGDLTVMESGSHIPFSIARVFVVRGHAGSTRGKHAHKLCTQFLTCPYGMVEVICTDGRQLRKYILDKPDVGLLIPPGIWAQQNYLVKDSVLTVLCDRIYESQDYIREYDQYIAEFIKVNNANERKV